MTDDDEASPEMERLVKVMAEVKAAMPDRPHDALLLMKEAYAIFQSLPREDRELLDQMFATMSADPSKPN